ncbi:UNKNOWN [Stylonychia lemnae]|uniref:Uncharacterized protein n=1 Tax=Stylonychia lemnae TaxID=5949 RepID=A0A078B6Z4_STYLE|nr:UNKNOWN [Stylonychia lemnae]|eukprot:CDW90159.1 UNKNOWN [Stylonychia lemnae]
MLDSKENYILNLNLKIIRQKLTIPKYMNKKIIGGPTEQRKFELSYPRYSKQWLQGQQLSEFYSTNIVYI